MLRRCREHAVCCSPFVQLPNISSLCVAQLVDSGSLQLALHFAKAADNPYFRIGYNSLGAYGTINHLHFQVRRCVGLDICLLCVLQLLRPLARVVHPVHIHQAGFAKLIGGANAVSWRDECRNSHVLSEVTTWRRRITWLHLLRLSAPRRYQCVEFGEQQPAA